VVAQLNQVFMNLLLNAAQSVETNGTVTIRSASAADEVWVEVEDTGHGIAADDLRHIFDPFFTTRPVGQGLGLGLSVSFGIVAKHGGRIEVSSALGKGSVFRVCLPIVQVQSTESTRLQSSKIG
jgi:signal transduction histidine kinase